MEVQAQAKWVRTAPRKVKLVADALRGMPVSEALTYCKFIPKASARDVAKVIRSAQANAEHNFNLAKDDLVVKDIRVESGPTLKRARRRPVAPPRAARSAPAPAPAAQPSAPEADASPSARGRAARQPSAAKAERETKTDKTEKPSATRAAKKSDSDQPKKGKKN